VSVLVHAPDEPVRAQIQNLLSPFGNRLTFAPTLAEATALAGRGGFAVIISIASGLDALIATPGLRTPVVALMTKPGRPPEAADASVRWPAPASALYRAINTVLGAADDGAAGEASDAVDAAIDAKAFAELEKSLGFKTLIDILQSYLTTAEELATALNHALEQEDWTQAGKLAQDIAGAAGGLGLSALTSAARSLAQGAREGTQTDNLSEAGHSVLSQHARVREALRRLYPDLAA
jgi:HPt (histidine-containing phosphotransfer) domain-containing protein